MSGLECDRRGSPHDVYNVDRNVELSNFFTILKRFRMTEPRDFTAE